MTKNEVLEVKKIIDANLKPLTKMVSKDLGIRFPRLRLMPDIDVDNTAKGSLVYWLYLRPKNRAVLRKCHRNKLLNVMFQDAFVEGLCSLYTNGFVRIDFSLKVKHYLEHYNLFVGTYLIKVDKIVDDENGAEFTTRSIGRV